jgi:ATP-binding cassette subfamily F protein 3
VCDQFVLVANGGARIYDGDLDDYAQWLNDHRRGNTQEKASTASKTSGIDKRQLRQQEAARRQQLKPYLDQVRKSEKLLGRLQQQLQDIEQKLADSSLYEADNKDLLKELLAQQATLKQQLQQTENDWLEATETLELAENTAV